MPTTPAGLTNATAARIALESQTIGYSRYVNHEVVTRINRHEWEITSWGTATYNVNEIIGFLFDDLLNEMTEAAYDRYCPR